MLNIMYSHIMLERCEACDEVRPLIQNICKRCIRIRKMKPRLPKEEAYAFTLGYESRRKR